MDALQLSAPDRAGFASYRIANDSNPAAIAAMLAATAGVATAKPARAIYPQVIPNDQYFGPAPPYTGPYTTPPQATRVQWDMYYIQMPNAWSITEGSSSVRIAVIDTGYDASNIDICSKVVGGAVFDNGGGVQDTAATPQDDAGHGTAVSGIASSVTNNAARYAGVAWNASLLEVRVFQNPTTSNPNPPGATSKDIAAAIDWAIGHGANVINMSLGAPPPSPCDPNEQAAINNAVNANVTVVVASGNFQSNALGDPADCNGVIVVGASALNDTTNPSGPTEEVPTYSSYANSSTWGLVAPGGDPDAAQLTCNTAPLCDFLQWITNNWSTTACCANSSPPVQSGLHGVLISGTSMAAPHVAGVVALMISQYGVHAPAQIAARLMSTTDQICGCSSSPFQQGAGRLNAANALAASP